MDQFHMIDVGGYRLSFQQYGRGSPTVVFEHGLDSGSASLVSLAKEIQHVTGTLVYDRAGLGQSEAGPRPRTSRDMANDLHILLRKAQIAGPYILVGQSIGGLNVRVYAHQYPEDVAGIIFLDASHPAQWTSYLDLLPPASPSENPAMKAFRLSTLEELNEPMKNQEGMDVATSAQQVAAIGGLGHLPVVVITALVKLMNAAGHRILAVKCHLGNLRHAHGLGREQNDLTARFDAGIWSAMVQFLQHLLLFCRQLSHVDFTWSDYGCTSLLVVLSLYSTTFPARVSPVYLEHML